VIVCPREVRVVDGDEATSAEDSVDVGLEGWDNFACIDGFHQPGNAYAVDVNSRLAAVYSDRHLFTRNHDGLFESALALPVVQESYVVVVAKHKEIVVVTPIPACDLGGLGIPVGLGRVRVDVPFVPLGLGH